MKTLILGVGNPVLSDDGVGIHVARILRERELPGVHVEELAASGLELLDVVLGYDKVVIVDAIKTESGVPGEYYVLEEKNFERSVHGASPHGVNIATALALGRKIVPDRMPKQVVFIAVEADDLVNVSEELTERVRAALPKIVKRVTQEVSTT